MCTPDDGMQQSLHCEKQMAQAGEGGAVIVHLGASGWMGSADSTACFMLSSWKIPDRLEGCKIGGRVNARGQGCCAAMKVDAPP